MGTPPLLHTRLQGRGTFRGNWKSHRTSTGGGVEEKGGEFSAWALGCVGTEPPSHVIWEESQ